MFRTSKLTIKMKRIITVTILLSAMCLITQCSTEKNYNYLPNLQVNIPKDLQNNPDAVNFITDNTFMLNNWTRTFENFAAEYNSYKTKNNEKLTTEEREKLGETMMDFIAGMGKFKVDILKMQQDADYLKCELSKDEIISLDKVMQTLNLRAKTINERYFNFDKEL